MKNVKRSEGDIPSASKKGGKRESHEVSHRQSIEGSTASKRDGELYPRWKLKSRKPTKTRMSPDTVKAVADGRTN